MEKNLHLGGLLRNACILDGIALLSKHDVSLWIAKGADACSMQEMEPKDSSRVAIVKMQTFDAARTATRALANESIGFWTIRAMLQKDVDEEAEKFGRNASPEAVLVTRQAFEQNRDMFALNSWVEFAQALEGTAGASAAVDGDAVDEDQEQHPK